MRVTQFKSIVMVLAACVAMGLGHAKEKEKQKSGDTSKLTAKTFEGLRPRAIGPAFMSGRIADVAIHPKDQSTWYVAVGSGGVWKTTNAATTWTPIFDGEGSYSIGCVAMDPSQPETIWVGTGENVGGRHVGYGDGVYRSLDGGKSWKNMGLKESEHIGNIVVHPNDSNVVFVAAQGPLWSKGGERGLYKTTDGGATWKKVLGDEAYTGVNEVVMDPRDSNVLYASTHQRFRTVAALVNGGPGSGIHKSVDGGETWRKLTGGLPKEDMGKIGLAVSPQNPDVVYATIELAQRGGGFYRSANGGEDWEKRSDYLSGGTGPHYYQEIFASPHKFDRIYQMDPNMHVSEDGGATFREVGEENKHGDNHALAFNPKDPDYLLSGSDGGLYESWDLGRNWKYVTNLPVTQFYKVAVDYDEPFYNLYGGTQDNNTQGGPSQTMNLNGIRNSDWFVTLFGDGHQPAVDPTNPDIVYSEWQQGNLVRYDRKNGEIVYIRPQPEEGGDGERFNWDAPILISAHDPARLYYASHRVWRSDDRGDSWRAVSGDLTQGIDRLKAPMMDRVQSIDAVWDLWAMSNFSTITSLGESPKDERLLYAGTDDGLLQVSEDGGENWRKVPVSSMPGVPKSSFINDVKADLHDVNTVYVVLDNHKEGDFKPYVMKSTDRGASWKSITGDLPDRHIVWRLVQDHVRPELLFVGTEFGMFFSPDGGKKWIKLSGGVPNIAFRDLAIQKRENDLVGASFGRGFYILDDYTPLRQITEEKLAEEALFFPVKDAWWYHQKRPLGSDVRGTQGADYFAAPNPPFGAVFTYYLAEGYKTKREQRREQEKELIKDKKDTPHPGWDALREEENEVAPQMILTVTNSEGQVVRRITGPVKAGFHRVAWDLRYPSSSAWRPGGGGDFFGNSGRLATPGSYSVTLAKYVGGVPTQLGEAQSFEVKPLVERALPGMPHAEAGVFMAKFAELERANSAANALINTLTERFGAIRSVLEAGSLPDMAMRDALNGLEAEVRGLRAKVQGDPIMGRHAHVGPMSIGDRISAIRLGNLYSTYGPTPTHVASYEIASKELESVREGLNKIFNEILPELERKMEDAGLPWTPGRPIPPIK